MDWVKAKMGSGGVLPSGAVGPDGPSKSNFLEAPPRRYGFLLSS